MRTLLILLLIYMLFRTFVKYVAPVLLKNFIDDKMNQNQQKQPQRPEGEVKVEFQPKKNKKDIDADYVDFKEIK